MFLKADHVPDTARAPTRFMEVATVGTRETLPGTKVQGSGETN